jgi:hypothetical protein
VFGWSLNVAYPTRNLSGPSTTRDSKNSSGILNPLRRPSLLNMLYWLLLLVCAYASSSLGQATFSVGQKWQIILSNPPVVTNTSKVIALDAEV